LREVSVCGERLPMPPTAHRSEWDEEKPSSDSGEGVFAITLADVRQL